MVTGPLTADERELLAVMAREPDEAAWRTHYRLLKLPSHECEDNVIQRRINVLLGRPDAQLVLAQQRTELERNRMDAMRAADGAHWHREKARQDLERSTYELAQAAMDHELGKFKPGGKPSTPSSVAKLLETGMKIAGSEGGGEGMPADQRRMNAKKAGIPLDESDTTPSISLPPGVEEGKA